ncbi:MAG: choice-of-anchor D domain-containing protein, partial [Gemmatimonadaceae bacterium]|nr:choice-of-anchor D domain-containing protein [Gloeobacterales cyanobacterium ES-bin-141]
LPDTIPDKDGEGTGFTSLQLNAAGNQYDASRIELNAAEGSLILTATQGSNASSNNLKNALQVPIDSTRPFTVHARLKGPFTNLTNAYQQGGIFLGTNQDNYVKFVVVNTSSGTGGLALQFYQEQNSVRSNVGSSNPQIRGLNWASITTLDLYMSGDPVTGIITAAYRVNSDSATPATLVQQFAPNPTVPFFSDATTGRAGVLAYTGSSAADVAVRFDAFDIEYPTSSTPAPRPSVTGTSPVNGATNVPRNAAVIADVSLPNPGAGVLVDTLTTDNVQLFRSGDNAVVPGAINTSGGGDAIVFQPSVLLDVSTNYTFKITEGVTDQEGISFLPLSISFNTGTGTSISPTPGVSFTKLPVYEGAALSSLLIGPDGKLYAASLDGILRRWTIDSIGSLTELETYAGLAGRAIIGLAFDPTSPNTLWVSHNETIFVQPAPDFTGKVSKLILSGEPGFEAVVEDYIVGLPRSAKDHLTNSLAFGPDGLLYLTQGSNSAMGDPDDAWYNRPERLLNAAVLQIDPRRTDGLPIDVQTEDYGSRTGTYSPYAADSPVKLYGTGVRNAYDLVWHSNGFLYTPTNGSAAGGNTPASPIGVTPSVPAVRNAATQDDFLFKVEQGGYYGHPNALRGQYVMNGGNPTSQADLAEVVARGSNSGYQVGILPDANYRSFAWDFGRNRSPNGAIEYKSDTFAGALKNKLLVVEYSAGDDILALTPAADGSISAAGVTQVFAGLTDPLDLAEDTRNGNLYVAELIGEGASGRISLLRPSVVGASPNLGVSPGQLVFNAIQGTSSPIQSLTFTNTGNADLVIPSGGLSLGGSAPEQFSLVSSPTLPLLLVPGASATVEVRFSPTATGSRSAVLNAQSTDPDSPQTSIGLQGLGTLGEGGANEPSLQWVLDTYQIPVNVGDPDPTNNAMPTTFPIGEEIRSERFVKVGDGPVTVEPVAVFGPQSESGVVVRFGHYGAGNPLSKQELFTVANESYQTLGPAITGGTSFDPGSEAFGLYSVWPFFSEREVYSEDNLNTFAEAIPHHVRVYPLKKADGTVEPNAYVVATEETTSGFDYQDIVVILRNVQPEGARGMLQVVTPDAGIVSNRLVFSTVNESVRIKTLTLTNTGNGSLNVTGLSFGNSRETANAVRIDDHQRAADFTITSPPTLPFTLAAGASRSISVKFEPQRVSSISNGTTYLLNGENYATFTLTTDDPIQPTSVVDLAGINFANFEGNNEPAIAEIARIFGWTLNVGTEKLKLGGAKKLLGDETYSPNWVRADTTRPVLMWPLAVTSGRGDGTHGNTAVAAKTGSGGRSGSIYTFAGRANDDSPTGTETPGSNDLSGGENQKLLPKVLISNVNTTPSTDIVDFTPNSPFTYNNSGTYGDDARNGSGQLHNWRLFPVRDQQGMLIPHYWYGAQDIGNTEGGAKNYDYNDHVYLIVNAKPESGELDPSVAGLLPGAPGLVLDFDTTYSGTLTDKDGEGTGFTSVQLNKNDGYTATNSYNPSLIDVDLAAGTLTSTTAVGLNANTNNTLVNGLLQTFDGRAGKFVVSTTLRGPLNFATANQQAGIMLGPEQDNYVKLVATVQSNGKLGVQYFWEKKAVGATVGSIVSLSNPSALQSLELRLVSDPQAGTVQAAYQAIYTDGTDTGLVFLPGTVQLVGGQVGHYFAAQSKAGLITSHINATVVNAVFDRFAIISGEVTP